eukprot:g55804.t1
MITSPTNQLNSSLLFTEEKVSSEGTELGVATPNKLDGLLLDAAGSIGVVRTAASDPHMRKTQSFMLPAQRISHVEKQLSQGEAQNAGSKFPAYSWFVWCVVGGYGPWWALWASSNEWFRFAGHDPLAENNRMLGFAIISSLLLAILIDRGGMGEWSSVAHCRRCSPRDKGLSMVVRFWACFFLRSVFKYADGFGRIWALRAALYSSYQLVSGDRLPWSSDNAVFVEAYCICFIIGLAHLGFWLTRRAREKIFYDQSRRSSETDTPSHELAVDTSAGRLQAYPSKHSDAEQERRERLAYHPALSFQSLRDEDICVLTDAHATMHQLANKKRSEESWPITRILTRTLRLSLRQCFHFLDGFGRVWALFATVELIIFALGHLRQSDPLAQRTYFFAFYVNAILWSALGGFVVISTKRICEKNTIAFICSHELFYISKHELAWVELCRKEDKLNIQCLKES